MACFIHLYVPSPQYPSSHCRIHIRVSMLSAAGRPHGYALFFLSLWVWLPCPDRLCDGLFRLLSYIWFLSYLFLYLYDLPNKENYSHFDFFKQKRSSTISRADDLPVFRGNTDISDFTRCCCFGWLRAEFLWSYKFKLLLSNMGMCPKGLGRAQICGKPP